MTLLIALSAVLAFAIMAIGINRGLDWWERRRPGARRARLTAATGSRSAS